MEDLFRHFLKWIADDPKAAGSPVGELHLRLEDCWETWLSLNLPAALALSRCKLDLAEQHRFLEWLRTQSEFPGLRGEMAFYRLVRCRGFKAWVALDEYRRPSEKLKANGVYATVVLHEQTSATPSARKLTAVLSERQPDHSPLGSRPANFAGKDAEESLQAAYKAMLHVLKFHRAVFLFLAYLMGSSSLLITIPRDFKALRALLWRGRLRRVLQESDCYALLDIESVENTRTVEGKSLGVAWALALLLAGIETCLDDGKPGSAVAHVKFINRFFPRLAASGFSGALLGDGSIEKVDEIEAKLEAMERRNLGYAVLPNDSRAQARQFALELYEATSLPQVLRWLMHWRLTSLVTNCLAVFGLVFSILLGPALYDDFGRASPQLDVVETYDAGSFSVPYLRKQDLPVNPVETIRLHIANPHVDGHTEVEVRVSDRFDLGLPPERLQDPDEQMQDPSHIGDLHPSLNLNVKQGQATFVYRYQPNPCGYEARLGARDALEIVLWHRGRFVTRKLSRYSLTLAVK